MSPYLSILSARFRMLLQYRAAALAGFVTQLFWGFIRIMILEAFYRTAVGGQPMSFAQAVGYVWLGQAFLGMLPWNLDGELGGLIRSGGVAYELVRPLDLYNFWYARVVALRTAPTLLRASIMFPFAMIVLALVGDGAWALRPPASVGAAAAFSAAMVGAVLLSAAITALLVITMLWTIAGEGVMLISVAAVTLLSGMVIPLPLFPQWMQLILRILPFSGLVDTPYRLYTGNLPASQGFIVVLHQLLWTAGLVLLGRFLLSRGLRRLVVQGG